MKPLVFRVITLLLGAALCVALLAGGVTTEVPRGGIYGTVVMSENGKPLPKAYVSIVLQDDFGEDYRTSRTVQTKKDGTFELRNVPAGTYTFNVNGKAHHLDEQTIAIEEGQPIKRTFELVPSEPYLDLYSSQKVFIPGESPSFQIRGFDKATQAEVTFYELDLEAIAKKGGLRTLLYSFSRPESGNTEDPARSSKSSGSLKKDLVSKDVEGIFTEPVELPKLKEGLYYVKCAVGGQTRGTFLNVSKIGLITKSARGRSLCYVSDLVTGKPVASADISTLVDAGLKHAANTDANGVVDVVSSRGEEQVLVVARSGKSTGVVDFRAQSRSSGDQTRIFMVTDRPVYRPGDTVQFKGTIRRLSGSTYSLPGAGTATVEILDSNETRITRFEVPVSQRGSFASTYTGSPEDEPGSYSVHVKYGDVEETMWVEFAAYRKPEFSIDVSPTQDHFFYGDAASAKIKCEYYFGGPVIGAVVEADVYRSGYSGPSGDSEYDYEGPEYGGGTGEYRQQIKVVTDEKGEAIINFPTRLAGDVVAPTTDFTYTIYASVKDDSGKYFDAQGEVTVYRGDYQIEVDPDQYIAQPGQAVNTMIRVQTLDDKPAKNADVVLQTGTERWNENVATFIPIKRFTAKTDEFGLAKIPVNAGTEGSLVMRASVRDVSNRTVTAESYLWVEGDALVGPPTARFTLTLDKRNYNVGDTCRALIQTDKPGAYALVTVEADSVKTHYVVQLKKPATMVRIPVTTGFAPNVTVSAVAIKDKRMFEAQSELVVEMPEHKLKVEVTPDKPNYLPGETATVSIKTTDSKGSPVPAELSVGVVDESIYAIRKDNTDPDAKFYPLRSNEVATSYSFEEIYLDGGDKGGGMVPVRSKFKDTASWMPMVQTDENGMARTTVELPDNLTSWRITAVGISDTTQIGMTTEKFRVSKPLMVRMSLPAFLVQGDRQQISATLNNDSGKDQEVNVRLELQGVTSASPLATRITAPADRPATVTWDIDAPTSGEAKFTVYAVVADGPNDAEERTIPVQPHGNPNLQTAAGEIADPVSFTVDVAPGADPKSGGLAVTISPSIASSLFQSLDRFIDFPYGCVEQTMSRFLPTVVLADVLKGVQVPDTETMRRVPTIVKDSLARLSSMQRPEGPWGWWTYDEPDLFMTAYVLDGLYRAKAAGYQSERIDTDSAVAWAKKALAAPTLKEEDTADYLYLALAVAEYGSLEPAKDAVARIKTFKTPKECALAALIYHQIGEETPARAALAALRTFAYIEGGLVRFKVKNVWAYGAEEHAFALLAYATVAPSDPFTTNLARHLMLDRRGEIWWSTRDSSLAIVALSKYLKVKNQVGASTGVDLVVNGGTPIHIDFTPESLFFAPNQKITIPVTDLKQGRNDIRIARTGEGAAYYSAELRQIIVADRLPAPNAAQPIAIERKYYVLETQRMEDGTSKLMPSKRTVDQVQAGDLIRVEITLGTKVGREFIMVEDPIPSTCRITEREDLADGDEWSYWWTQTIVRDNKAAFFVRRLRQGGEKLTYTMRAEKTGRVSALPPVASNMYDPSQTSFGGETRVEVTP